MIDRTICWFSCGAASACATKFAIEEGMTNVEVVYQDTGSEHPDNERFLSDCQDWFGVEVKIMKSEKYRDIWEVFAKTNYLSGVAGARCSFELKRKLAQDYINPFRDQEVFGYTAEESSRLERFVANNEERIIRVPLIERGYTKEDCLGLIDRVGIEIPEMYKLGFTNNNCIGCVKGQAGYWNHIRRHFPETFERMAKEERRLNAAINKKYVKGERVRVFLDELPEDMGNILTEPKISCGLFCMTDADELKQKEK